MPRITREDKKIAKRIALGCSGFAIVCLFFAPVLIIVCMFPLLLITHSLFGEVGDHVGQQECKSNNFPSVTWSDSSCGGGDSGGC